MEPREELALRTARMLVGMGHGLEQVLENPLIPADLREIVRTQIQKEQNFTLVPSRVLVLNKDRPDWLKGIDRSTWYYWPALRDYLLATKGWDVSVLRSLDNESDRILRQLADPTSEFDIRGLVLGYVQSGKTANYTALIAKAADAGYRLIIVLSGMDNGLRRQTNLRLKRELVGYPDGRPGTIPFPPLGRQWHEFTQETLQGDFRPGFANSAALQGSQPVLLVVKKNGPVLRRLLQWLDAAPPNTLNSIPTLVIDDEADQGSIDTRGTHQAEEDPVDEEYEPPSKINGLIRDLLRHFSRKCYVAYTATPFANIFIPHDTHDPEVGSDLYPKDFIVDLPKPAGYFGAEEFFGRLDANTGEQHGGMNVVEPVTDTDLVALEEGRVPASLVTALHDFVLAGAARATRIKSDAFPATMLIHTSQRTLEQGHLRGLVTELFEETRDAWRYHRKHGVREELRARWDVFQQATSDDYPERMAPFESIEPFIGPFFEAVEVREINSAAGEVLDYEHEPNLKAIAVGGNKLSRGLTLEGLLISYYIRRSIAYDTLMQMGRWFGYRSGYEDLIRIYTTSELADWFSDLAFVEFQLREDIGIYEDQGLTPHEVGMRIKTHPTMQITSRLKRRFARSTTIALSYSGALQQTFKYPLRRPAELQAQERHNLATVKAFLGTLGTAQRSDDKGPVWINRNAGEVLKFLRAFRVDERVGGISMPLVSAYVERLVEMGELTDWTVAVRGREKLDRDLGTADWGLGSRELFQVSRSRLGDQESLGVITSPGDELCGLDSEEAAMVSAIVAREEAAGKKKTENAAAREIRKPTNGLLLLYPISRNSGRGEVKGNRRPLFENPRDPMATDLIGLALSFPGSKVPQKVEAYLEGTAGWRPAG